MENTTQNSTPQTSANNSNTVKSNGIVYNLEVSQELRDLLRTGMGGEKIEHIEALKAEAARTKKDITAVYALDLLADAAIVARDKAEKKIAAIFGKAINIRIAQGMSKEQAKESLGI